MMQAMTVTTWATAALITAQPPSDAGGGWWPPTPGAVSALLAAVAALVAASAYRVNKRTHAAQAHQVQMQAHQLEVQAEQLRALEVAKKRELADQFAAWFSYDPDGGCTIMWHNNAHLRIGGPWQSMVLAPTLAPTTAPTCSGDVNYRLETHLDEMARNLAAEDADAITVRTALVVILLMDVEFRDAKGQVWTRTHTGEPLDHPAEAAATANTLPRALSYGRAG